MTAPREPNPFITIGVWLALWWGAATLTAMALGPQLDVRRKPSTSAKIGPPNTSKRRDMTSLRVIEGGRR